MFSKLCQPSRTPAVTRAFSSFDSIGKFQFDKKAMQQSLSPATFDTFNKSLTDASVTLGKAETNEIAQALLKWALGHGCTNFAHWYHPLRHRDARAAPSVKFDSFIELDFGSAEMLKPIKAPVFNGTMLFNGETDGSSFCNGGMRQTSSAAAYVGWDKTSAPFIRNDTLYLPACFVTFNGEALDYKTPLLRAANSLNEHGLRVLRHLGDKDSQIVASNVGCEQEYFLMDAETFAQRPDLVQTGRALYGAVSPRNQEGSENYFGTSSRRARAYFTELREELWKLGVSVFVNHNEVAPSQLELSPIFSLSSVAADQNVLMMEVMDWLAAKHGVKVLFHEKPFAKVNGSGKHNNWGLNTDTGKNLLAPGKTNESTTDFTMFVTALMTSVHMHGDVIRTGVAVPGNDHRLGAQEAPPAIMSLYTGDELYQHLESVARGGPLHGYGQASRTVGFGTPAVQAVNSAISDRNRTAPFPFCGNRFEFRAVGSSQNIAQPLSFLDTAMSDGLCKVADLLDAGRTPQQVVAELFEEHKAVIFNGNGYGSAWPIEAAQRGLPNNKNCVEAWRHFDSKKNIALFAKYNVMTEREVHARKEIALEDYANTVHIEAQVAANMAQSLFLPALAKDLQSYTGPAVVLAGARPVAYKAVFDAAAVLDNALAAFPEDGEAIEKSDYCLEKLIPAMNTLRDHVDTCEGLAEAKLWPVPSYQEMLLTVQNSYNKNTDGAMTNQ